MALSPTQEAQVLALVAQEAALLSLAAEEPAIISNLGATDVSLSDLSAASSLADADLLLVRQGGTDKSISGLIVKTASTVADASETVKGIVELATVAEAQAGTDTVRAVTPAGLAASAHPVGSIIWVAQTSAPTGHLKANGAVISRTTYAALFAAIYKSATVTMTIAAPGVITWNGHGLNANDPVQFTTTGTLPTGFVTATNYYVVGASITANTFQLSATAGGAAITTTGSQSGIHTAHNAPFGIGDGSTTFNVPDLRGRFIRGWVDNGSIDTGRAFGSGQTDALQNITGSAPGIAGASLAGTGAITMTNQALGATMGAGNYNLTIGFDASLVARTATETRPTNVALLACIKY